MEYLKEKEKWLNRRGFDVNVKKLNLEKKTMIPNYVYVSPGCPVYKHRFRDVNKNKWINNQEFVYKNPHDLIL